ncbi:major facilitator superfamily domain-containing protein [Fusarium redolens]|uniref:Major facilitator superfamily domain-containing protein n=1 Tax=Fusarium redolens TaxID=48865 RepID=A0A9P9JP00_FUSRE|nr:major facilitator superfamily domain-containing protein [Fusarium redolens]KAH7204875.1 major facilitator superfamily domain-containing protein [Fusarium redolens]
MPDSPPGGRTIDGPSSTSLESKNKSLVQLARNSSSSIADAIPDQYGPNVQEGQPDAITSDSTQEIDIFEVAWDNDGADPLSEFHNRRVFSVLGLSAYVLGIGIGPMFLGPLSEFYGRRPLYLLSWTAYLLWQIPQAASNHIAISLVFRFLSGFSGSTFFTVPGAPMALFSIAPFLGLSLGPLIGGFINYNVDWRWIYYVLIIWVFALWWCIFFLVLETYHPILLKQKARRLRKERNDDRFFAPIEKVKRSVLRAIAMSSARPFQLLAFEPMCLTLSLFSALLLGILYLFFGTFPLIFGTTYGFNQWQSGLAFIGIMISMLFGVATDPIWRRIRVYLIEKHDRETGVENISEPEFRLPPAILGSLLVPIGLFMFAWTSRPWIHWIVPIIGSAIFGAGNALILTGIFTFLVEAYPVYAASTLAANSFVRNLFAAGLPLFGNQMYTKMGYQWASSLIAFLTLALMPLPYIFLIYGKKIRAKSRHARRY